MERCEKPFEITTKNNPIIGNAFSDIDIILCNKKEKLDSKTIKITQNYTGVCLIEDKINCIENK